MFKKIFIENIKNNGFKSINNIRRYCLNVKEMPQSKLEEKLLKVAVIGLPNAGKSTFINCLMDRKVCPASARLHTTRSRTRAIFTEGNIQVVFLDNPGIISLNEYRKFNLERSFMKDSKKSIAEADLISILHDASNLYTRDYIDVKIIKLLEEFKNVPSVLIMNKVDLLKSKRKILDITRLLTQNCIAGKPMKSTSLKKNETEKKGWPHFQDVFMISSLTGVGLEDVRNYFLSNAKTNKWMFPEQVWTDQTAESLIEQSVKAKLLDFLPQELPYILKPHIEYFDINEEGKINTVVVVTCPSARIAKLVAGESDGRLRQIIQSVQRDLHETFNTYVRINITMNVK